MPQPASLTIHLQAIAPDRNIARDYLLHATPDLFGHWVVELRWGRIGAKGQGRVVSFPDEAAASRFVRCVLARRHGARRRIGVGYERTFAGENEILC